MRKRYDRRERDALLRIRMRCTFRIFALLTTATTTTASALTPRFVYRRNHCGKFRHINPFSTVASIKQNQEPTKSDFKVGNRSMAKVQPNQTDYNNIESTSVLTNPTKDAKIYLHTGNIANWTTVKSRRSNDMPANELYQSLYRTLSKWSQESNGNTSLLNENEVFVNCGHIEKMDEMERRLLKVTAKVFLHTLHPKSMKEAVEVTLKQLGLRSVDSLYLALPPLEESAPFAETVLPHWEEMERLRDAGIASQISSCDLDKKKLKTLVERVKIRPEVNQVNLTSCCHMPEDLVQYAKDIGIVLHTHGDQPVMLPEENLEALMHTIQPGNQRTFKTNWVVRYSVVVKCRGVIKTKGYIASVDAQK